MQKTELKVSIFQRDIFRIQSGKSPIGLHGEGGKSNLSYQLSINYRIMHLIEMFTGVFHEIM